METSSQPLLRIRATGACSPLGVTSYALAAAATAGIIEPRATPWRTATGRPLAMVFSRFLPPELVGLGRLVALAAPALRDACTEPVRPVRLLVALPEQERTVGEAFSDTDLLSALSRASGMPIDVEGSRCFRLGQAGFGLAVRSVVDAREHDLGRGAIVGAIDSYFDRDTLLRLDEQGRLHGPGAEAGFVPSEGAAFLSVVASGGGEGAGDEGRRPADIAATHVVGEISFVGCTRQTDGASGFGDEGRGELARLTELALASCPRSPGWIVTDVNGERSRARQWAAVEMQLGAKLDGVQVYPWPVVLGDAGSANAALAAVTACCRWQLGTASHRSVLLVSGTAGRPHCAVLLGDGSSTPEPRLRSAVVGGFEGAPIEPGAVHGQEKGAVPRVRELPPESAAVRDEATAAGDGSEGLIADHLRLASRNYLSEIAALQAVRVPDADLDWRIGEGFERRLVAALDAALLLRWPPHAVRGSGWSSLREIEAYGVEGRVVDRGRVFTSVLLPACTTDREAVRRAVNGLCAEHPVARAAAVEALALAPGRLVDEQIVRWLDEGPPGSGACAALGVLVRRRAVDAELAGGLLASSDPSLQREAVRALGVAVPHERARALLRDAAARHPALAVEIGTSLVRLGALDGLQLARRSGTCAHAASERPDGPARIGLLRLLALAGDESDLERIATLASDDPSAVELVGWFGHIAFVPWLVERLAAGNRERPRAMSANEPPPFEGAPTVLEVTAARALERIAGARGRDALDPQMACDAAARPSLQAEGWQAWWRRSRASFDAGKRYRFGRPFGRRSAVRALAGPGRTGDRRWAELELHAICGPSRWQWQDWVARQRASLEELQARLRGSDEQPEPGAFAGRWVSWRHAARGD